MGYGVWGMDGGNGWGKWVGEMGGWGVGNGGHTVYGHGKSEKTFPLSNHAGSNAYDPRSSKIASESFSDLGTFI